MRRRVKSLVVLAIVICVVCPFLYTFGAPILTIWTLRHRASEFPVVNKTPVALTDLSVSRGPGKKFTYLGYDFEVPWTDIDEGKSKLTGTRVVIAFDSEKAMTFAKFPPDEFLDGIASTMKSTPDKLRAAFGDQIRSDYAFKKLILYTTPGRITFLTPWRQCISTLMLVMFKVVMVPAPDIDLFSVQTDEYKGFQFGDPKKRPRRMGVELYSDEGMLELYFSQKENGQAPGISQSDINRVIQSVHKTENKESVLAK